MPEVAATPNRKGQRSPLLAVMGHLPQLAVVAAFGGSAVAMKLAPAAGLLPSEVSSGLVEAYVKFLELPGLRAVATPIGLGARGFMTALAVMHLLAAASLAFLSSARLARAVGLWVMVTMSGAEYCTRATGFTPPGVPERYAWHVAAVNSLVHATLFALGLCLCLRPPAVGLLRLAKDFYAAFKARRAEARADVEAEDRGRPAARGGRRARDATPVPKAKEPGETPEAESAAQTTAANGAGDSSRCRGGTAARAAAAAVEH